MTAAEIDTFYNYLLGTIRNDQVIFSDIRDEDWQFGITMRPTFPKHQKTIHMIMHNEPLILREMLNRLRKAGFNKIEPHEEVEKMVGHFLFFYSIPRP